MSENFNLQLLSATKLNEHTVHFNFKILNQQKLDLIAGQFIRLLFTQDGEEVFRSYSVANTLKANTDQINTIDLAVSWVKGGLATVGLQNMNVGDTIEASAPFGRFCLTDKSWERYFLVATGTGVTPYKSMGNELLNRIENGSKVYVIMGARDKNGLLYADEFKNLAKNPNYHYISCLSRCTQETTNELEFSGRVQSYLKTVEFNPETDIAYLCGNPAMVDDAFALLKEKGLPVAQIRREKYVSPPIRKKKASFVIK